MAHGSWVLNVVDAKYVERCVASGSVLNGKNQDIWRDHWQAEECMEKPFYVKLRSSHQDVNGLVNPGLDPLLFSANAAADTVAEVWAKSFALPEADVDIIHYGDRAAKV